MKKPIFFFIIIILAAIPLLTSNNKEKNIDSSYKFLVLDNGLPVVMERRDSIPLVNIVFAIDMGSKDEDAETSGMVHMLEHLLLLGDTRKNSSKEINRKMRSHGAYFNAHTSHDMMTFEISMPAEFWEFGIDIIKEKLFDYKFTTEQLTREKEIIFEEISQHNDVPYTLSTQLVLHSLFKGHPYQQPIFGSEQVIKKTTIEEINAFYSRYVVPDNCSLAVVGDIDIEKVSRKVDLIFGSIKNREKIRKSFHMTPPLKKKIKITRKLDIKEARMVFGFHAPSIDNPNQLSMDILKIILGRGINPLLGGALLKMRKPLTYSIHTRYIGLQYGGAFMIYITLDPKNVKIVQRKVTNFLKKLWKFNYSYKDYPLEKQGIYTDYLEAAKNQIKILHQQFQELGLNAAMSYAKYALFYKEYQEKNDSIQPTYMERVENITSADIRNAASQYLSGKKYVLVTIFPEK